MGRPRRRRRTAAWGSGLAMLALAVLWGWGLVGFAQRIPDRIDDPTTRTDAIVVLTGGSGRLDEGLDLLTRGLARQLFVSGVYGGVDVSRLLQVSRRAPQAFLCCVSLGHAAASTAGNAVETAAWAGANGIGSLRLVTANYHMPRSLLEFRHRMPAVRLIPHAVFPANFKHAQWWAWPGSANLVISEYAKFSLARLRQTWEGFYGGGSRP